MTSEIAIVDYGMGNLRSVEKGFEKVGASAVICSEPEKLESFPGLVLPGVGAFGDAMRNLADLGLVEPIKRYIANGKPFLGICLGMQLLLDYSEEHGRHEGLGIVPGSVERLPPGEKVPHMGWNVMAKRQSPLLEGIEDGTRFYFVHSFYCVPRDDGWTIGTTPYGIDFTSAVGKDHVWGVQFHPEKSSILGLRILDNFSRIAAERS